MRNLSFILLFIIAATSLNAKNTIIKNIANEYITCSSYFILVHASLKEKDISLSNKYKELSKKMFFAGYDLYKKSIKKEIAQNRFKSERNRMLEIVNRRAENLSILIKKHESKCIQLYKNPEKMIKETTKKSLQ